MKTRFAVIGSGNMAKMHCISISNSKLADEEQNLFVTNKRIPIKNIPTSFSGFSYDEFLKQDLTLIDFFIVAVGAPYQFEVLNKLDKKIKNKNILIEKNITNRLHDLNLIEKMTTNNIFINLPLIYHESIKYILEKNLAFDQIRVMSNTPSIFTNSIHYLHLGKVMFGEDIKELRLLNTGKLQKTKRNYAKDIFGIINARFDNNKILEIHCKKENKYLLEISLYSKNILICKILPDFGKVWLRSKKIDFIPFLQSNQGSIIIESIINKKSEFLRFNFVNPLQKNLLESIGINIFSNNFHDMSALPIA